MLRGYRNIVFALAGFLSLAAAPPQQAAGKPQAATENQVAAALENVASSLNRDDEAPEHNQPCNQGADNRNSDLCAQWYAADAAKRAADAGWVFGYVGTVIGLLTLAAAGAAAWYARKAAIHTQETAVESKRAADAAEVGLDHAKGVSLSELRPWIQISVEPYSAYNDPDKVTFYCLATLKNLGRTPAQDVQVGTTAASIPATYYKKYGPQEQFTLAQDEMEWWQPILPGGEITRLVSFEVNWADTEPPHKEGGYRYMCPYVGVHVTYALSGDKRGETAATFQIGLPQTDSPRDVIGFKSTHKRVLDPLRVKEGVRGKIN